MRLTEGVAIALHSIVYISNKGSPATVKEISTKFSVSDNHLSKILQRFVKEGILVSEKGPKGGFYICDAKKDMTLLEVYEVIEGKFECQECLFCNRNRKCKECIMSDFIKNIDKEFLEYMRKHKITDFRELPNLKP